MTIRKGVHNEEYDRSRMRDLSNQVYDRTLMILVNIYIFFSFNIFIFIYGTQSSNFWWNCVIWFSSYSNDE